MLAVINQLNVKAEYLEELTQSFAENAKGLEQEPGFAGYRFLKPLDPESSPCIVETYWEDAEAFEAWKKSEHFKQSHQDMGRFRDAFRGPPQFGRFEVVRDVALST